MSYPLRRVRAGSLHAAYSEVPGSGRPIILVHGNWSSRVWWEAVLRALEGRGVRVLAYDLRGRGDSEGPDNGYTMREHAEDLFAFADALGVGDFHLVGHSLGSAVAFEAALWQPARVTSLAAFGPSWIDGMPAFFNHPHQQRALATPGVLERALAPLAPSMPRDDFWRRCVAEGAKQRVVAAERNLAALTAWRPGDALGALTMPRTVITGELDVLTGGAVAKRVAEALGTELVTFAGAGHCVPMEAPERSVQALLELTTRSARAA